MDNHQPNRPSQWGDPIVSMAVAGVTAAVGALGPTLTRQPIATLGELFSRSPFNRKRLARCVDNIRWCLPGVSEDRARRLAHDSWRHLFLLAAEASMDPRHYRLTNWPRWIELGDVTEAVRLMISGPSILVTGHCGNWELLGSWLASLGLPLHPIYRKLDNRSLDAWVQRTRARVGLHLVDKFGAIEKTPDILANGESISVIADENVREKGVFVPFFDRLSSAHKSIGLLAMRHQTPIICGMAQRLGPDPSSRRVGPLRFRIDVEDIIRPDDWADQPDPLYYITARYRRAIEMMIRQAPGQCLWMHDAWKTRPRHELEGKPTPTALREKIERLPWMTPGSLERILTGGAAL